MSELIINNFGGLNQALAPHLIQDNELTDLYNAFAVREGNVGRLEARKGFGDVFPFSHSGTLLKIFEVNNTSGVRRIVFVTTTAIVIQNPTNGTTTTLSSSQTAAYDHTMVDEDTVLITTNAAPKIITNVFSSPILRNLGLPIPDISSVLMYATQESGSPIKRQYCLVYYTEDGEESVPSQKFGLWREPPNYLVISNLPTTNDPRIVGKRLYRTKANDSVFYRCADLAVSTTTWNDTIADEDLDVSRVLQYGTIINACQNAIIHKNRLWVGNVSISDTNPFVLSYLKPTTTNDPLYRGTIYNPSLLSTESDVDTTRWTLILDDTSGIIATRNPNYYIFLKTADGRYSHYYYRVNFTLVTSRQYYRMRFKQIWTAFFGAGDIPYDEYNIIEFWGASINYTNKYRKFGIYPLLPTYSSGSEPDVIDSGQAIEDNLDLPSVVGGTSTAAYPSAIYYSDIDHPQFFPAGNRFQVASEEGGAITGLVSLPDGVLVIKQDGVWKIFTEAPPSGWRLYKIGSIGALNPAYWGAKGSDVVVYRGNMLYSISGGQLSIISKEVQNYISNLVAASAMLEDILVSNRYVILVFAQASAYGKTYSLLIYDKIWGKWTRFNSEIFSQVGSLRAFETIVAADTNFIDWGLGISSNDVVASLVYGNANDRFDIIQSNVLSTATTKQFRGNGITFRNQKIIVHGQSSSPVTILLNNESFATFSNLSGYHKFVVSDNSPVKKTTAVQFKILWAGGTIEEIKLIFRPSRGKYGE